jgi:hypothetical protein
MMRKTFVPWKQRAVKIADLFEFPQVVGSLRRCHYRDLDNSVVGSHYYCSMQQQHPWS